MPDYSARLAVAEQSIADFINGKSTVKKLESDISVALSNCNFYGRKNDYKVSIIKMDHDKQAFFGARIYPSIDYLESIVMDTVVELHPFRELSAAWQKIDHWVIELDGGMFDRSVISLVPKEIMAAILHEVGHTVYSDKVLERFYRAYRSMKLHMKNAEKDSIKAGYAIFTMPLAVSCGVRTWTRGKNAINEEYFADKIVRECGYGDFYISLLSKIVESYGNSIGENTETECDNKVSERVRWASVNIVDTVRRKNRLKDDMYLAAAGTPSVYLKALTSKVLNEMGIGLRERYTGDAIECRVDIMSMPNFSVAYEMTTDSTTFHFVNDRIDAALQNDKFKPGTMAFETILRSKVKQGLPSWRSIDAISIEIDRITNHHDRSFVLDMIYNKIDEINEFMEYVESDPVLYRKYQPEAQRMLDALDEQREAVLRKRSFSNRYAVFVKSPDGYEG